MINTDDDGPCRTITLDRPARRNALTPAALDALDSAIAECDRPVIQLRGAGSAFSAGADLDTIASLAAAATTGDTEPAYTFARAGQQLCTTIERSEPVVVCSIDGPACGGGLELALACDVRICTPQASFGEPGVTFGLFGAWGGTRRLVDIVGPSDAFDLTLSGRTIDASTARSIGLVSRVVDDPSEPVAEIAAHDPETLTQLRSLLHSVRKSDPSRHHEREATAFASLIERHAATLQERRS